MTSPVELRRDLSRQVLAEFRGQLGCPHGAEHRRAEGSTDAAEERGRAGGCPELFVFDVVLDRDHQNLHDTAESGAEDEGGKPYEPNVGVDPQRDSMNRPTVAVPEPRIGKIL